MIRRAAVAVAVALLLAACGNQSGASDGTMSVYLDNGTESPQDLVVDGSQPPDDPPSPTSTVLTYRYKACTRKPPAPGSTHLRASDLPVSGTVVVRGSTLALEHATDLVLLDGTVRSGAGYDGATGGGGESLRVSQDPVTAPVTLAVIDSPSAGRRVAFLEVQVRPTAPVRWVEEPKLGIVTDGGDGAFIRGGALGIGGDEDPVDAYVDAFYPGGDNESGNVCVLTLTRAGDVDSVMFSTGIGDGGYPTFVGYDAAGEIVSLVSYGGLVPWSASGLPGAPPPADALGEN